MAKYRRPSAGKEIRPTYFVFCEGETEESYVSFIRSTYRIPIQIKTRVAKTKISQQYVSRVLKQFPSHKKDKCFLMYDLDKSDIVEKLRVVRNAILLVSNPCIELWYILHTANQTAEITSQHCIEKLERICKDYSKGPVCKKLEHHLTTGYVSAIKRAKKLSPYNNPSTTAYLLIEEVLNVSK